MYQVPELEAPGPLTLLSFTYDALFLAPRRSSLSRPDCVLCSSSESMGGDITQSQSYESLNCFLSTADLLSIFFVGNGRYLLVVKNILPCQISGLLDVFLEVQLERRKYKSLNLGLRPALVSHVWSIEASEEPGNSEMVVLRFISPLINRSVFYTLNFISTVDYDITTFLSRSTAHQLISTLLVVCTYAWLMITSLFSCSLSLPSISMLRWIEDIDRKFQEDSSLQYRRQLLV